MLKQTGTIPATIALELSQLIVFMLKASSGITGSIFTQFQEAEGYTVLAENLIYVGKQGSKYVVLISWVTFQRNNFLLQNRSEQLDLIGAICHLLFVDGRFNYDDITNVAIRNNESFQILLWGFQETPMSVKTDLLNTISAIFSLGGIGAGYSTLQVVITNCSIGTLCLLQLNRTLSHSSLCSSSLTRYRCKTKESS